MTRCNVNEQVKWYAECGHVFILDLCVDKDWKALY